MGGHYTLEIRNRSAQICGLLTIMRLFIATFITVLSLAVCGFASANFNGTWVLDLKASDSPEPMMKRMGVSALERKLAVSTKFESTYSQSGNLLTITTRGPAFSRTEAVPPIKTNIGENASLG